MANQATRGVGRRSRTSELDEQILITARRMVAAKGLDETSAALLAEQVGTSVGPIYSRYDTMEDLAVELWRLEGREALENLLGQLRSAMRGDGEAVAEIAATLAAPVEALHLVVEILAAARRYPFLREEAGDDVEAILGAHFAAQPEVPPSVALAQVHVVLGGILLAPVSSPLTPADFVEALTLMTACTDDLEARTHPRVEAEATEFSLPQPETGDGLLDAFNSAVLEVVAQVGYAKASANRIARRAGHGFSTVYSHFETKDEFMEAAINLLIDQIVDSSAGGFIGLGREQFIARSVANARGLASEANRLHRHLRTEVILAARHHSVISDHMNAASEEELALSRAACEQAYPTFTDANAPTLRAIWILMRSHGFGLSLLRSTSTVATQIEWTPCSVSLWNVTNNSLFTKLA